MALDIKRHVVLNPAEGLGPVGSAITFTTAGTACLIYSPARPVRVVRYGVVVKVAPTGSNPLVLRGDVFPQPMAGGAAVVGATTSTAGTGYNSSNAPTFFVDTS